MEKGEIMYFLDTNIVIWLYEGDSSKFSSKVLNLLNTQNFYLSPFVKLELQYLFEVKRTPISPERVLKAIDEVINCNVHNTSVNKIIETSMKESWTRDHFDRLITSHAKSENAYLITKDQTILSHYSKAIWK